jgi:hypothetical protein
MDLQQALVALGAARGRDPALRAAACRNVTL